MQFQTGSLTGTVTDQQGGVLAGATITLKGGSAPVVQATDAQGRFRFLGLVPGDYTVEAELEGFATVTRTAVVDMGRQTELPITLPPAIIDDIPIPS